MYKVIKILDAIRYLPLLAFYGVLCVLLIFLEWYYKER